MDVMDGIRIIENFHEIYRRSMLERNVELLLDCYHDDIEIFDAFEENKVISKEGLRGMFTDWYSSLSEEGRYDVFFRDIRTIAGDDILTASFIADYTWVENGEEGSMMNRFTWVLKRTEGEFLIIHEHSSVPGEH